MFTFPQDLNLHSGLLLDRYHLSIPSQPDWIGPTVDYLVGRARACGAVEPGRESRLLIALHEALTNSVVHGNLCVPSSLKEQGDEEFTRAVASRCADPDYSARRVHIWSDYDGLTARWSFADEGAGFDAEATLRRLDSEEPNTERPSGRGILMIRAFVDELRYEDHGRRLQLAIHCGGVERRAHARLPLGQSVQVAPLSAAGEPDRSAERYAALAHNISEQGIGLLQAHPAGWQEHPMLLITIPTGGGESVSVPAEVRHWRAVGERAVELGCRFELTPGVPGGGGLPVEAAAALAGLVERLREESRGGPERRAAPRVPYTEGINVEGLEGEPLVRAFARDLSRAGIAFFSTRPLPLETVRVELPQGPGAPALTLKARVLRCNRLVDTFFEVAAQFVS